MARPQKVACRETRAVAEERIALELALAESLAQGDLRPTTVEVRSMISGEKICLVETASPVKSRDFRRSVCRTAGIPFHLCSLFLPDGLTPLNGLQRASPRGDVIDIPEVVLMVRVAPADGIEDAGAWELRAWLSSLDDGAGAMLSYFDVLAVEFDADLQQIAAAKVEGGTTLSLLGVVDPSFWETVKVQKAGHKMLFARGIAML
jgi:hypothetical protein